MTQVSKLTYLFFVLAIFFFDKGFSQTKDISSQETRFVKVYSSLLKSLGAGNDSTEFYSDKFSNDFSSFIKANPATLNHPFKKLIDSNYCFIKTSSDNNFRVYSWDTWTGGTMHFFNEIYQWKDNGKVFTKVPKHEEGDAGSFCSKIFTVNIKNKVYYLTISNGIYSTKDASQSISVYTIDNDKLIDTVKLFKTKTKRLNRIDVEFDFFSVVERPERPLELITYDDKQKIIYVPVVGDKGRVTNRNIQYQLKDKYFEFIGIESGKRK
jgi:hypothetical protein